jgi:xanthine dehydrogenase accessory factor
VRAELLQLAAELARRGEPFVLALVVRREAYSSAHQGDMAIITADGGYHGWLGGNCTQPTVKREARRALADGKPRLVSLSPEPARDARPGVTAVPMTCSSGGSVDIYLEPVLPPPELVVFGPSPVARALARLGQGLSWRVTVVDPGGDAAAYPGADRVVAAASELRSGAGGDVSADVAAVVATMGESDEDAIEAALALGGGYLAVVASRKRFALVRETLAGRGVPAEALARVRNPAGLDVGAVLPEELALSILAEIVQVRRAAAARPAEEPRGAAALAGEPGEQIDPVCGMTVVVEGARHRAEHDGRAYLFCNARCREKFLAAPARYLSPAAGAGSR